MALKIFYMNFSLIIGDVEEMKGSILVKNPAEIKIQGNNLQFVPILHFMKEKTFSIDDYTKIQYGRLFNPSEEMIKFYEEFMVKYTSKLVSITNPKIHTSSNILQF